jgi:hypothetical protein
VLLILAFAFEILMKMATTSNQSTKKEGFFALPTPSMAPKQIVDPECLQELSPAAKKLGCVCKNGKLSVTFAHKKTTSVEDCKK